MSTESKELKQDSKLLNQKELIPLLLNRFQFIADADNSVEAKASVIAGFSVAIILAFSFEVYPEISKFEKIIEARLGLVLIIFSLLITLFLILKSRQYGSGVVMEEKINQRIKLLNDEFTKNIIIDLQQSIKKNVKNLQSKNRAFKYSLTLFIIGSCLLLLSVGPTFYL